MSDSELPDLRYVKELAKVFRQYELDEIEIETNGQRILLRRSDLPAGPVSPAQPAPMLTPVARPEPAPAGAIHPEPEPSAPVTSNDEYFTSPFVGTFYAAPRPDAPAFVQVGAKVQAGQTVCIVEAMKLFNEIEAEFTAEVLEVLAENGQAVEFGAKLFRVRRL